MPMDNVEVERDNKVSVTWKWFAIASFTILVGWMATDRNEIYSELSTTRSQIFDLQKQVLMMPTKEDFKLLDIKLDNVREKLNERQRQ